MNNATLEAVLAELKPIVLGRRFGKVIPLSRRSLVVDFRLPGSRYLFIAADPRSPRLYLVRRRLKDLERVATNVQPFHLLLKKYLSGSELIGLEKAPDERILIFRFAGADETGEETSASLVAQLTGKSSNLFLVNGDGLIVDSLIAKDVDHQRVGETYLAPLRPHRMSGDNDKIEIEIGQKDEGSVSAALDRSYSEREAEESFRARADKARRELDRQISKRRKLIDRLNADLKDHGDAERWKRFGDLILANLSTAKRIGDKVIVRDYFSDNAEEIEIDADERISLTELSQKYFKRYTKASSAAREIESRKNAVEAETASLEQQRAELERAIESCDESMFAQPAGKMPKRKEQPRSSGTRQFTSSDGFRILVGKKDTDNDQLTFRIAGSLDVWLHAADYPGSHVVIRNPDRNEVPHRTLIEAAQLAAFYSSAKSQPKAAVHYTQKKFVNKPRGAAPGLVRLASFKTILVTPEVPSSITQG